MTTYAHIVPLLEAMANTCGLAFELRHGRRLIRITPPCLGPGQHLENNALSEYLKENLPFNCTIAEPNRHVWGVPFADGPDRRAWLIAHAAADRNGMNTKAIMPLLSQLAGIAGEHQSLQDEIEEMATVLDQSFEELALYARIEEVTGYEHFSSTQLPAICKSLRQSMQADLVFVRIPTCPEMTVTAGNDRLARHVDDPDAFIEALLAKPPPDNTSLEEPYYCLNDSRQEAYFNNLSHSPFRFLAAQSIFSHKPFGWIGAVSFTFKDFFKRGQMRMLANTANQIALLAANTELLSELNRLTRRVEDSRQSLKVDLHPPDADKAPEHLRMVEFLNRAFTQMSESIASGQTLLAQSAQLASVGQLASVFAHEIKQPLTALSGMVHIAQMEADSPSSRRNLNLIAKSVNRMVKMVKRFGSFSKPVRHCIAPIGLNNAVVEVYQMVKPQLVRHQIRGMLELEETLSPVMADSQGLQQVVLNLLTNAVQAMEALEDQAHELRLRTYFKGRYACLDVEDTGPGIDPTQCQQIFDPYYTTKTPDQGTGLGLSVARDIMEQFGGTIDVESRPAKGSRFTLRIPCAMSN